MSRVDQNLHRLSRLAEAARDLLCQRSEPVALQHAAGALNTALTSLLWEKRGQGGGHAVPSLTDDDRAFRAMLFDSGLGGLVGKSEGALHAALRLAVGYTYAIDSEAPAEALRALDRMVQEHLPEIVDTETEALLLLRFANNIQFNVWNHFGQAVPLERMEDILAMGARGLSARPAAPKQAAELLDRAARLCRFAMVRYRDLPDGTLPARWWRTWRENLLDDVLEEEDERLRDRRASVIHLLSALSSVIHLEDGLKEEAADLAREQTRRHLEDLAAGAIDGTENGLPAESMEVLRTMLPAREMPLDALLWTEEALRRQLLREASGDSVDRSIAVAGDALVSVWAQLALAGSAEEMITGVTELWDSAAAAESASLAEVAAEGAGLALSLLPDDRPQIQDLIDDLLAPDSRIGGWEMHSVSLSAALEQLIGVIAARQLREPAALTRFFDQTEALTMHPTTRAEIDRRLASILGERLSKDLDRLEGEEAGDTALQERCLENFDRIQRLSVRGTVHPPLEILERLVLVLPVNHPRRSELRRQRQRSRSSASPMLLQRGSRLVDPSAVAELENRLRELSEPATWPLPPFFRGPWRELEGEELLDAIVRLAGALPEYGALKADQLVEQSLRGRRVELPFYPGWDALEVLLMDNDTLATAVAVESEERVMMLRGTSPPIHLLNKEVPVLLDTPEQVEAYIRFFCGAVHGEEGPFHIVSEAEDLRPLWASQEADQLAQIEEKLRALSLERQEDGFWSASTSVLYSNALFAADFKIHPTGMVEMLDDSPLTSELPVVRETFAEELRRSEIPDTVALEEERRSLESRLAETTPPAWPLPPLITVLGEWQEDDGSETATAVVEVAQALPKKHALKRATLIEQSLRSRRLDLPFYEGWSLVEILVQLNEQPVSLMVLDSENSLLILDGTSATLHAHNKEYPVHLETAEQAAAYLELFCNVIEGQGSPFRIVGAVEDLPGHALPGSEEALAQEVGDRIRALSLKPDGEGGWLGECSVLHLQELFTATFKIQPTGEVEMLEDDHQAGALPVHFVTVEDGVRRTQQTH